MDSRNLPPLRGWDLAATESTGCARGYILTPLRGWNAQLQFIHSFYARRYNTQRRIPKNP